MTRAEERKRATELKAVDVRALIRTSLPDVPPQLTAAHVDQLQRVLDAAVINADVQKKWEDLDRQAIKGKIIHSNEYLRDPAAVARRDQVLKQKIVVKPTENVVRLDFNKLLTPGALKSTSDNPDEAGYLLVVAEVYERRGVWLLLDSSAAAVTRDLHPNDPTKWRVRLLLGYKPGALIEEIKTETGTLTRNALLSVTQLGAGYWEWVHQGPTLTALKNALDIVSYQINLGTKEHAWWSLHRTEYYVVSRISDKLGGADWPNERIWDQPHQVYVKALHLINAGKLMEAGKFALLAAYQAEWCARAVHEYIDATTRGATRAVKVLEVAVVLGKIAEGILSVIFIGQGLIRLLSRRGATAALEGGAQRQLTGGQRQLPAPAEPVPTPVSGGGNPGPRGGSTAADSLAPVKPPRPGVRRFDTDIGDAVDRLRQHMGLPARTLPGRLALAENAQLGKAHKEFIAWLNANPNASLDQKLAQLDSIKKRLGVPLYLD
jgi:hypothetical protein